MEASINCCEALIEMLPCDIDNQLTTTFWTYFMQ